VSRALLDATATVRVGEPLPRGARGTRAPSALAIATRVEVVTVLHWRSPSPVSAIDPAETNRVMRVPFTALADPDNSILLSTSFGWRVPAFVFERAVVWGTRARSSPRCSALEVGNRPGPASNPVDLDQAQRAR
jgi:hypothetical protein